MQKTHGSCVLPNPVLGPRLAELVLSGCPRILHPNQLLFTGFPPSPPPRPSVLTLNDVLSKCIAPVRLVLLSIRARLVNPAVWLTRWSKVGATSRRLRLSALEHVRHFGFAVPLQVGVGLAFMFLCCSVVGLVLTVKDTCDVSNPVQVKCSFPPLVRVILLLPWQFRDKCPCGQDCW